MAPLLAVRTDDLTIIEPAKTMNQKLGSFTLFVAEKNPHSASYSLFARVSNL
jgi:hypothetical protein